MRIQPSRAPIAPPSSSAAEGGVPAPHVPAQNADRADLGDASAVHVLPNLPYAVRSVSADAVATEAGRSALTAQLIADMKPYPSITAVVGLLPPENGCTRLVVAGRDGANEESEIAGAWRLVRDLSSSPSVKAEAVSHPVRFEATEPFDTEGRAVTLRLPGSVDESTLAAALSEGGQPNPHDMLRDLVQGLPKGKRVVILLAGPSAAGKSTLASEIAKYAENRHVAAFPGDMFFRDADDPALPRTRVGGVYWDHPEAMHFDEMADSIAKLVKDGSADIPVYDFGGVRPGGWRIPHMTGKGLRTDQVTPLTLGNDDILVIDSLHAANRRVIEKLEALDLPHVTVYLDAERAEDRLVRRMVRDFDARGRSPQETLADWDMSTFPGEVHFVRPTLLNLDPAQDLAFVNKFPNDLGLTREALDHKVALLDRYGLAPSYDALRTSDDALPSFAEAEEKRLRGKADDAQVPEAERAKARTAADRISRAGAKNAPAR